jgi:hypothetical protein
MTGTLRIALDHCTILWQVGEISDRNGGAHRSGECNREGSQWLAVPAGQRPHGPADTQLHRHCYSDNHLIAKILVCN